MTYPLEKIALSEWVTNPTKISLSSEKNTGVFVTIHGHFYQPPRENPYLDAIERQPSASPYHDWNERIHHECYRPNAFARVFNDRGEILGIVNNFEYLSFNIGPTLMNWLEHHDQSVYQRILEGDRQSCQRLNGHGNAISQVYNHIIMPLANKRDKLTQIRWGIADFYKHFGRYPEGMWLAETAVDYSTLEGLIAEGIRFIILAPSQAERCRPFPTKENPQPQWSEVGGSQIDPTRPYRCYLKPTLLSSDSVSHSLSIHRHQEDNNLTEKEENLPYIDIFFYDGPISRDMGFNDVLNSSEHLAGRLGQAIRGDHRPAQLISVATDGETFGHHKKGTEKCLAYGFVEEFPRRGWTVTNFAHYLSLNPPHWEVELKPITAWSCCHGVDRWQEDCGCGGGGGFHQKWRRPLRDSLNWLRDQLIPIYEEEASKLFRDPWLTRDDYISVIKDRSSRSVNDFFARHQNRELNEQEKIDGLRLLEMQRHALLMFTSCGWFFEEISRPEGVQILRYAARAIELAGEVAGVSLERKFLKHLASIPSNVKQFKNGVDVYHQLVTTHQINFKQVAAHYAISSLFTNYHPEEIVYCYQAQQLDYQIQHMGTLTLAVGQVELTSEITWESQHFVFAVLHLGGWDFHCCIQPFGGRRSYALLKERLFTVLKEASAANSILEMVRIFGDQSFSLKDLFAEERHRIMGLLSQETLTRLDQLYTQVYRDNYGIMMAFHRDDLTVPVELKVAAEVALNHRCLTIVRLLESDSNEGILSNNALIELEALITECHHLRCQINHPEIKDILQRLILRSLDSLLHQMIGETLTFEQCIILKDGFKQLQQVMSLSEELHLELELNQVQELYLEFLYLHLPLYLENWQNLQNQEHIATDSEYDHLQLNQSFSGLRTRYRVFEPLSALSQLLQLATALGVDITPWLSVITPE